jgi:Tfp pilus assembly protein PilF
MCRLEENGDYDNALESAHKAMSIYKKDVWALHAEAHVYEMQGRANEGQSRLRATVIY